MKYDLTKKIAPYVLALSMLTGGYGCAPKTQSNLGTMYTLVQEGDPRANDITVGGLSAQLRNHGENYTAFCEGKAANGNSTENLEGLLGGAIEAKRNDRMKTGLAVGAGVATDLLILYLINSAGGSSGGGNGGGSDGGSSYGTSGPGGSVGSGGPSFTP